jgi:hypothetical protein|tara:strand:- start:715 stop:1038 length:324 start_codon:yes stop_codon:yes gene_type:complete
MGVWWHRERKLQRDIGRLASIRLLERARGCITPKSLHQANGEDDINGSNIDATIARVTRAYKRTICGCCTRNVEAFGGSCVKATNINCCGFAAASAIVVTTTSHRNQ